MYLIAGSEAGKTDCKVLQSDATDEPPRTISVLCNPADQSPRESPPKWSYSLEMAMCINNLAMVWPGMLLRVFPPLFDPNLNPHLSVFHEFTVPCDQKSTRPNMDVSKKYKHCNIV